MATELDKLVVKIEADLSDLKKGMEQANKSVKKSSTNMSSSLSKLNNSLTKIRTSMLKVGAVVGVAFGALAIRNVIKTGMEIQGLEIRFNNLFGSVEEGNKAFKQLLAYAGTVPFSLKEIQAGSGSLAVVAKDAEHLRDIMEITGNVAVISGLDFATASSQIQRVFAGGLAAADIFREKGISQIIKDTGMMVDTVDGAAAAFEAVFSGKGKFANATKEMANTVEGTFSMVGDTLQAFTIAVAEGFFVELTNSLQEFNQMLQDNRKEIVAYGKELGGNLGNALKTFKDNFDAIVAVFGIFISLNVASMFFNLATALHASAAGMVALNVASKTNPFILAASAAVGIVTYIAYFTDFNKELEKSNRLLDNLKTKALEKTRLENSGMGKQGRITKFNAGPMLRTNDAGFNYDIPVIEKTEKKITQLTNEQYHERQKNMSIYMEVMAESRGKEFDKEMEVIELRQKATDQVMEQFEGIGQSISTAFGEAVVSGKDFKDSMVDIFQSVAQQVVGLIFQLQVVDPLLRSIKQSMEASQASGGGNFLSTLFKATLGSVGGSGHIDSGSNFAGGYGRAGGGSVNANMPYMVGERGAEMFVPKSAGNIVNSNNLASMGGGGSIVIEQNLNFATGVSQTVRAEVMNLLPAIQESTLSAVRDARLRGGSFAKDFGG